MILILTYILFIIVVLRFATINYNLIKSVRTFNHFSQGQESEGKKYEDAFLNICIPCLREQNIIEKTLKEIISKTSNCKDHIKIYVVTTQKEEYEKNLNIPLVSEMAKDICDNVPLRKIKTKYHSLFDVIEIESFVMEMAEAGANFDYIYQYLLKLYNEKPSTHDVVKKCIQTNNWDNVELLHYPHDKCCMADQLNYAYKYIVEHNGSNVNKMYFMVYNADCHPNKRTFELTLDNIKQNKYPMALQLIRSYTLNTYEYKGLSGLFLKASALYQTRWSLGFEYPMYNSYLGRYKQHVPNKLFLKSQYMIGHGMTFRLDFLNKINGFNPKTNLEDLFIGYVLSYLNVPIYPIPVLENTLNPSTIDSWKKQKMVWFSGMYDVRNYITYLKEHVGQEINVLHSIYYMICFYVRDTLPWLLGPTTIMLLLLLSFFTDFKLFVISLSLILINGLFSSIYLQSKLKKFNCIVENEKNHYLATTLFVVLYSMTRNIPSIIYLIRKSLNKSFVKYKTER